MASPTNAAPAPRLLWWGAIASGVLMLCGAGAFAAASINAGTKAPASDAVVVTLRDGTCQPSTLTVPAGRSTFRIENQTARAVEWEILDGVMVVEERENIAPGLSQTLSARLSEGTYAITCGLLSNPRGTLTVTASDAPGGAARPTLTAFIGPLAEYQVYLGVEAGRALKSAAALQAAIQAGDRDGARAAYAAARVPYLHLAPVAARFADLRDAMDVRAGYLANQETDPAFTGYHRIGYGLFQTNDLAGLDAVSARLASDAATLKDRLRTVRLGPDEMLEAAVRTLRAVADTRVEATNASYARDDLAEIEAELAGVRKITTLMRPVAENAAPAPLADVEARWSDVDAALAALEAGDTRGLLAAPQGQRDALATQLRALADTTERLGTGLGLAEGGA